MKVKCQVSSVKCQKGQILIIAIIFLAVILVLSAALFTSVAGFLRFGSNSILREQATNLAEAGVDYTIWQLNETAGIYSGDTDKIVDTIGTFTTTIEEKSATLKEITSTGFIPNDDSPRAKKTIKVKATINTTDVSFNYGVQVGHGGLRMHNNSTIDGNVYSNGSIEGDPGATVTKDAYVAAGTATDPDQENTSQTDEFAFGNQSDREDAAQSFVPANSSPINKVSLYLKKVGTPNDAKVKIMTDNSGKPSKTKLAEGTLKSSKVTTSFGWIEVSFSSNPQLSAGVTYWLLIDAKNVSTTKYWIWGTSNNSQYSQGQGMYSPDSDAGNPTWTAANYDFNFKIFLGSGVTKIVDLDVGGDAHANTIENSVISGTAYCQVGTNNNKSCDTSQPDPAPKDLPISQANIDQFKTDAEAGEVHTGDFNPVGDDSFGPGKITGNLMLDNNQKLTITGTIWVQGNIDISNNAILKLDFSFGENSGVVIADGYIHIDNNGRAFEDAGSGSYILLLSTQNCIGDPQPGCHHHNAAIDLHNNVTSTIVYASEGMLFLHNGVNIKEAVAQKMELQENAVVKYESGLADVNFSSGPGGSWQIKRGTYRFTGNP